VHEYTACDGIGTDHRLLSVDELSVGFHRCLQGLERCCLVGCRGSDIFKRDVVSEHSRAHKLALRVNVRVQGPALKVLQIVGPGRVHGAALRVPPSRRGLVADSGDLSIESCTAPGR